MKTKLLALILALLMVTSMVPVSAIQMVMPETAAEDTVTIPEIVEEPAVLSVQSEYETYGTPIFYEDFEGLEAGTSLAIQQTLGNGNTTITKLVGASHEIVDFNGNNVVKLSGESQYNYIITKVSDTALPSFTPGKYTAISKYYFPSSATPDKVNIAYDYSFRGSNATSASDAHARWGFFPYFKADQWHKDRNQITVYANDTTTYQKYVMFTNTVTTKTGSYYYIDELALYYKPARTASYVLDGGSGTFDSFTYYDYETVTLSATVPTKADYAFVGWKASTSGKTYAAGATIPASEIGKATDALTLTAVWEEIFVMEYNTSYGEVIYYENFTNGVPTASTAPSYVAQGKTATFGSVGAFDLETLPDGNKVVKLTTTSVYWGNPMITVNYEATADGKYTVAADYYALDVTGNAGFVTLSRDEAQVVKPAGVITVNSTPITAPSLNAAWSFTLGYDGADSVSKNTFRYTVASSNPDKTFYIDNISLYFKPLRTATFAADGGTGTAPTLTYYDYEDLTLPENTYTKAGYVFAGWKSSLDGVTYAEGATIPAASIGKADAALTLTAVWKAIVLNAGTEIRTQKPGGIRFKGYVEDRAASSIVEYGFIVALENSFTDGDYSALVFPAGYDSVNGTNGILTGNNKPFVNGVCYSSAAGLDRIYAMDGNLGAGHYFSCVLTNMTSAVQYKSTFAARPYVKIGSEYFYGDTVTGNILTLAQNYGDQTNEFVQEIINACK